MIITRAAFRISFIGGGSDLAAFYGQHHYGAVISTSIAKYMYVMIHPYFHEKIRIKYSRTEDVTSIEEVQHPIVRECLKLVGIKRGIEIASIADVPAGTGLGSSSAFTVCLLHALFTYKGVTVTKEALAELASDVEINRLKEPIGKQDQYAASFGGLNYLQFNQGHSVLVDPISMDPQAKKQLEANLLMFYVGKERSASSILKEQRDNMALKKKSEIIEKFVQLTRPLQEDLIEGRIARVGEVLHEAWMLKKQLAEGISNPEFDAVYEKALRAGACGGKLLGAGGGGFFLFYCEPQHQAELRRSLDLRELEFQFDTEGSQVVYSDQEKSQEVLRQANIENEI